MEEIISDALQSIPTKKENLRVALEALQSSSSLSSSMKHDLSGFDSHYSSLQTSLETRFKLLQSKPPSPEEQQHQSPTQPFEKPGLTAHSLNQSLEKTGAGDQSVTQQLEKPVISALSVTQKLEKSGEAVQSIPSKTPSQRKQEHQPLTQSVEKSGLGVQSLPQQLRKPGTSAHSVTRPLEEIGPGEESLIQQLEKPELDMQLLIQALEKRGLGVHSLTQPLDKTGVGGEQSVIRQLEKQELGMQPTNQPPQKPELSLAQPLKQIKLGAPSLTQPLQQPQLGEQPLTQQLKKPEIDSQSLTHPIKKLEPNAQLSQSTAMADASIHPYNQQWAPQQPQPPLPFLMPNPIRPPIEEVRTVFISGLPQDVKDRELTNLVRWFPGFEASQLNFIGEKPMGFVLFSSAQLAVAAKDALEGVVYDPELKSVLHTEMAKKNLFVKKVDAPRSNTFDQSNSLRTGGDYAHIGYPSPYPLQPLPAPVWRLPQGHMAPPMVQVPPTFYPYVGYAMAPVQMPTPASLPAPLGYTPVQNDKDNPPCNTLFVGNLGENTIENDLRSLFTVQPGFKQMKVLRQEQNPVCFIEFDDVNNAVNVHNNLQGAVIPSSGCGGMRIQYSKNPFGRRKDEVPGAGP